MAWRRLGNGLKRDFSMSDVEQLLERQAAWQKSRQSLSWREKIRLVEGIRASVIQLRRAGPYPQSAASTESGGTGSR
jgi:hypothetical protein